MIDEHYRFLDSKKHTYFYFESEGRQGKVKKVVLFTLNDNNLWNLGFGDLKSGKVDDMIVTNNYDVAKVMRTIAKIVYVFFEHYPERIVYIEPVDEKRKRLYNLIFQRHFEEIKDIFELLGSFDYQIEPYSKEKNYDFFILKLKVK